MVTLQKLASRDCNPFLSAFVQSIRWRRKPIWFPVAKSKLFRIPERPKVPEDEMLELRRLYNEYRTQYKAVRRFLFEEHVAAVRAESANPKHTEFDEDDLSHALKLNEEWNKEVAAIRELRLAKEAKEAREKNLELMIKSEQQSQDHMKLIESIVKEEKEKSNTYITLENLDEAIEYALANPIDYNFAIDKEGNIIYDKGKAFVWKDVSYLEIKTVL